MTHASALALLGGPVEHRRTAPKYPRFTAAAYDRVREALDRGPMQGLSKGHPIIAELEERLAAYHDVELALATSSGHGALQSALIGLEITGGDEVLTSPYSWGASVSCILHNGAVPVFVDVSPETGLIDPSALAAGLTSRTRAILVPHLYGQPADMTAIMSFAEAHGLVVVEDGSQAHGARHRGRRVGGFGEAGAFSTNGVKPLATTEGGYLVTRVADVYWKATISGQHAGRGELIGRASEPGFPDELRQHIDSMVYTYRPNIVTALLTLDRLPYVDAENAARRRNASALFAALDGVGSVSWPSHDAQDECVYHMVTLNFDAEHAGVSRDTYLAALNAEGVPAVAYVANGLHRSPRLSPSYDGPRVMWTETLRRAGVDPNAAELPGCDEKVARSIEIPWNHFEDDPESMASLARAFAKLEEGLDHLRRHERSGVAARSETASA
ncbi:MAG TPA: aminotransferase class I/II-fold pyridoxal phosphate-dependent enzyme [Baekduia sp.]|uniref:DegT/DnrJ/EryC1/StrS family aminotransferase n=1 Tax=Baekduia sp. TaxID=2600305 RepID=UPI002D794FC5|nr:aminotransferase class I/II-fold pyridoxal phosphate-dependent enzyme [Baekduia sp.]HET6507833.1 aminotransferase class I/II-fold pyridoxal phosphate-dependent enzyme [Baekduia sp.]